MSVGSFILRVIVDLGDGLAFVTVELFVAVTAPVKLILNLNLFEMMLVLLLDTVLVNTFELPKVTVATPRASSSSSVIRSRVQ